MTSPITSIDDLFADAMQAQRAKPIPQMKVGKVESLKPIKTSERYSLPEFWIKGRVIALIHSPSQTLLGTFQEFHHKHERAARKLERLSEPAQVTHQEFVSDPWYLGDDRVLPPTPEKWTAEREILLHDLTLQQMGVHASEVEVKVCLQFGGIGRVELLSHTTFHSPDAKVILTIPAGTNVLECMSLDAKVELRKELQ